MDPRLATTMNEAMVRAWNAFSDVVRNFHEDRKPDNYQELVLQELLLSLQELRCRMSIKVHYVHSHFGEFQRTWLM